MFLRLRKKKLSGGSGDEYEDDDDDDRKKKNKKKSNPKKKAASKRKSEGTVSKRVTKRTKTSLSMEKVNEDDDEDDDEGGTVSTLVEKQLKIEGTNSQDEPNQDNQIEGDGDSLPNSIPGLDKETESEGNLEPKDPQHKLAQGLVQNSAGESDQDVEQKTKDARKQKPKQKSGRKGSLKQKDDYLVKATKTVGQKADKGTKDKEGMKKTDEADDKLDDKMEDRLDEGAVHQPESEAKLTSASEDKSEDDTDQQLAKDQAVQEPGDMAEEGIMSSEA